MSKVHTQLTAWLLSKYKRENILEWDMADWHETLEEFARETKMAVNQLAYIGVLEELRSKEEEKQIKAEQIVLDVDHKWITNKRGDGISWVWCRESNTKVVVSRIDCDKDGMPRCSHCLKYLGECQDGIQISVKEKDGTVVKYVLPC